MDFSKTVRAFAVVLVIVALMAGMTSMAGSRDADSAAELEAPTIMPTQTAIYYAAEPEETAAVTERGTYQGIEPNLTEDTLPDRAGFVYYPDVDLDRVTQDFIYVEAAEAAVDYELVLAIIRHESRCDPDAISATNDYGLMQINRINHEWLAEEYGLTNMLDPQQNIIAGITILAQSSKYDDGTEAGLHKMLMSYNMGPTGAAEAWDAGTYSTSYTKTIMQIRADLLAGEYGKEEG